MKILDCSTVESTHQSLADIFQTDIEGVKHFVKKSENKFVKYEGMKTEDLCIEDILDYFKLEKEEVLPDKLVLFHLTSGLDDRGFRKHGILNLENVIKKGLLNNFFEQNGISIICKENNKPIIKHNNKEYVDERLFWRFSADNCINGFLVREEAENNNNVKDLRECPEFISDISRLLGMPELVSNWKTSTNAMVLSLIVDFKEVNDFDPNRFIIGAVEYLALKNKSSWGSEDNKMVFLSEKANIPPSDILKVETKSYSL
ncbi:hypothetical protein AAGG74_16210 [Bacillus mexicanus]|uniref:hypothetical protein n=1 Tax=Bacillus mexicanus TaxID=2834415 RepID=UPI003D1B94FB